MGLDLTFYPVRFPRMTDWILACTSLPLDRDYEFFSQIKDIGRDVPVKEIVEEHKLPASWRLTVYEDEGLEDVTENPYGDPITFLYARELKKLQLPEHASYWNKAVMAFIHQLEDEVPVILWWH